MSMNPVLIQGGMGVGVSNWKLARAVSKEGQLGVVSGTMMDTVLVRRLQDGDEDGHIQRACRQFQRQDIVDWVLKKYLIEGGRQDNQPYMGAPMLGYPLSNKLVELTILANFVEVFLAKEGHDGLIGINLLEKIQLPTLGSLFGAMLAGVDYVLMGAGIPKAIPGILDGLSANKPVSLRIDTAATSDATASPLAVSFDPDSFWPDAPELLKRPKFLAIVSSHVLAINLAKKSSGNIDGFVIENHTAGGHNAPPRGTASLDDSGQPVYGSKDLVNLSEMHKLNKPFWLAGSYGDPERLQEAIAHGAVGIQVGTPFALCRESGMSPSLKLEILQQIKNNESKVYTNIASSACGYPFKELQLDRTLTNPEVYASRKRVCDLGYLRTAYRKDNGRIGWRCPGEPEGDYVNKGGCRQDTIDRKCLCNGLLATIGLGQVRDKSDQEAPLVTTGQDLSLVLPYLRNSLEYSARDVVSYIVNQARIVGFSVAPAT